MSTMNISLLNYCIHVGYDLADNLAQELTSSNASTVVIVTDTSIAQLHLSTLQKKLSAQISTRILTYIIPAGENSKSRAVKAQIEDYMLANSCSRDTILVALGGGVVGDLGGYVAATYMRGISYIQVPTTLLAMVDSSIGGKTGINALLSGSSKGKNLVGAFWQPRAVIADLAYLDTLPKREWNNGMAEIIKAGMIVDKVLFEMLESGSYDLKEVIYRAIKVKADIVSQDEREGGLRGLLNFGHSIGHAIEAVLSPRLLHGECVSIGMVYEAELARRRGCIDGSIVGRLSRCLRSFSLPTDMDKYRSECIPERLVELMKSDKKNLGTTKRIVLISGIGKTYEQGATSVSDDDLMVVLCNAVQVSDLKPVEKVITVHVPGSKSISNRVLLMAALGSGTCRISNLLHSDDTRVMLAALSSLGACSFIFQDQDLIVNGQGGRLNSSKQPIYLGNAGTAARFLSTAVNIIEEGVPTVLTGNARMKQRPIGPLVEALHAGGQKIRYLENEGCLPLEATPNGGFHGGHIKLSASISSQYVSSILMCSPYAKNPVTLELVGDKVISQPYIDMTLAMMQQFGVQVQRTNNTYQIPNCKYTNPPEYVVECDASSATYPLAIAALTATTVCIPTLGKKSLQGDAKFAELVLGKMGCTVEQTENETRVTGPRKLKGLAKIDMEPMTDAFLTAAVLAAVADGDTEIYGIENQRVKECDRIAAMENELRKFGVICESKQDGINVKGGAIKPPSEAIHCYDDHRVAMSCSLIAGLCSAVLDDKRCVEKTWPGWWDVLSRIGCQVKGYDGKEEIKADDPIVLIGMRGVGKSHIGTRLARIINYELIDMDECFTQKYGNIREFVQNNGWDKFRQNEFECLKSVLSSAKSTVIACGGGIIETEKARLMLKAQAKVIHIRRPVFIEKDEDRPEWNEEAEIVWKRREPLYNECSQYEYWNLDDCDHLLSFSRQIMGNSPASPRYFISLVANSIEVIADKLDIITDGCDAVELRVDLLQDTSIPSVAKELAFLRSRTELPVIFTVRSVEHGGKFTGDAHPLLCMAAKWGCEFIDVELQLPAPPRLNNSKIIASWHSFSVTWTSPEIPTIYEKLVAFGHIVKMVAFAKKPEDNIALWAFASGKKNLLLLNMGEIGKITRVTCPKWTPVTHQLLQSAAPGQLSVQGINQLKVLLGLTPKRNFYLLGAPITHSLSPVMHNAAFSALGLPHQYDLMESTDLKEIETLIKSENFGGASVTMPLKEGVMALLDEVTVEAQEIGAVNTIIRRNGKLIGDNTDWIGIKECIEKRRTEIGRVLILGSGGTARAAVYTAKAMGASHILVWNRSLERLENLKTQFPYIEAISGPYSEENVKSVIKINGIVIEVNANVIISTLPGRAAEIQIDNNHLLVELAYGQDLQPSCGGVEILYYQGLAQMRRWVGFCAPAAVKAALKL